MTTDRDRDGMVVGDHLLIMRDAGLRRRARSALAGAAGAWPERRLFTRGIYVVTEGPRFESPGRGPLPADAGDVVGQSFSPEVWLARDIGACYAGIYIIVNYGEGVVREWEHDVLARIFHDDAELMGRILLTLAACLPDDDCRCRELRKPTLLT